MKFLPRSLFYRFLTIGILPIIIMQIMLSVIFYERHWRNVTNQMQKVLAHEVQMLIFLIESEMLPKPMLKKLARDLNMELNIIPNKEVVIKQYRDYQDGYLKKMYKVIRTEINLPYNIKYSLPDKQNIILTFNYKGQILNFTFSAKRVKNPTTYIYIIWMLSISLILIITSTLFIKNQVKSIIRLAEVADNFGKGRDAEAFRPTGATEIQTAGKAFLKMKKRIERQVKYRTELLAHISHDLRTPLTRLKLQLALLNDQNAAREIGAEAEEMEQMIVGYLNFAKGEGNEKVEKVDALELIEIILSKYSDPRIDFFSKAKELFIYLRPNAFERVLTNIMNNSIKFANERINIELSCSEKNMLLIFDDDGPGIDERDHEKIFNPFEKLNPKDDGFGLGLAIVRNIVQAHGGKIKLDKSPFGGLRVKLTFPL